MLTSCEFATSAVYGPHETPIVSEPTQKGTSPFTGSPASNVYIVLSQICAAYYFLHFLVILPWIAASERPVALPNSITEAVLGKGHGPAVDAAVAH